MSLIRNLVVEPENKQKRNKNCKKGDEEDTEDDNKPRPIVRSATDLQRLRLEKLMKNPDKPIIIPESPREKDYMQTVPSFVRNVMGSSAGAGSGEFHVYRHLRRKEYARQKTIQAKSMREQLDDEYQQKLDDNKRKAEDKTAKKRAKRLKRKQRAKKPRGQNETVEAADDDKDEETSEDEDESEVVKDVEESQGNANVTQEDIVEELPPNTDIAENTVPNPKPETYKAADGDKDEETSENQDDSKVVKTVEESKVNANVTEEDVVKELAPNNNDNAENTVLNDEETSAGCTEELKTVKNLQTTENSIAVEATSQTNAKQQDV